MKSEVEQILKDEDYRDWTVRFDGGGNFCQHSTKTIFLSPDASKVMALHEIAHINAGGTIPNTFHDGAWADNFTRLVEKYVSPSLH